ncbi:hypothetical protein GE061_008137 [Apolygus lucorum]|uniref:Cytochrome P450 n=1 Tax=Apolygus lucorum TaxID=248454 RepID=A0A8S9WQD3_APOLU|nr:hypothetical protein GE061_008137 [Apolygus lucorum]
MGKHFKKVRVVTKAGRERGLPTVSVLDLQTSRIPPSSSGFSDKMAVLGVLLIIVAILLAYLIYYSKKINEHWKNRGVPHKTPMLFFGNSINAVLGKGSLMQENRRDILQMFPKAPLVGYYEFVKPVLIVNDLDLIQKVLIKDFSHFNHRPLTPDEDKFPELVNLSNMIGKRWKSLRNKMIPVFTTGKLRLMFEQMSVLSDSLLESINPKNEEEVKSVDLKKLFNCYSMDIIGSTAFGINVGSLKDNDNEFARIGRTAFGWAFTLRFMFVYNCSALAKHFGVGINSPSTVKYFSGIVKQTLAHRVASGDQRNDFVNLMLTLKEKGFLESGKEEADSYLDMIDDSLPDNERVEITEDLILSNAFLFIMAGFDTVGTLLALFCYDLSQNVDKQEKLRNEIEKAYNAKNGVFNYDTIRDTPYMEMCVKETMRLHTIVGIINRECTKEYTFPGTNVTVQPGESIEISSYSIHMNPEIYPEPEKFIPERFAPDISYPNCTWLPFGDGPRICIAMRFVITEVKCAMAKLLMKYDIRLNPKTILPIKPKPMAILYNTANPHPPDKMDVLSALLVILATLLGYFLYFAHKVNQHWKIRGIPHKKPLLVLGNSMNVVVGRGSLLHENRREVLQLFPKAPLVGFYDFLKPVLLVNDMDLVQRVLIKDFSYFNSRPMNPDEEKFPELVNLSSMTGKRWKSLRNKMIPVFTTGKLRLMFDQMSALSDTLLSSINPKAEKEVKSVDLKKLFNCYSMDIIGATAFGIDVGSLKDNDNEFARYGQTAFNWEFTVRFSIMYAFTELATKFGLSMNNPATTKYFSGIIKRTLALRKSSGVQRNDFVNLMLTLKEKGFLESGKEEMDGYLDMVDESIPENERVEITENLILSNAFLFIMAGFDTLGTLLAYFCLDLSQNIDKQDKLRSEVKKAYEDKNGVFSYDTIKDTPYMEMCVKETMRLHSLNGSLFRICNKEYTFPGTNYTIKPGESLEINVHSIHMNPEIYPEPEKFIPERFSPDVSHPSCSWLPFGDGPRVCIAMRFVITEVKCAMAKLVMKYDIRLSPNTQLPIKHAPRKILNIPSHPIYFDLIKRPEY